MARTRADHAGFGQPLQDESGWNVGHRQSLSAWASRNIDAAWGSRPASSPVPTGADYRKYAILTPCRMTRFTWRSAPTGALPGSPRLLSPHAWGRPNP